MHDITVDQRWGGETIENVHGDVSYQERKFKVAAPFDPSGDQAQAIERLAEGIIRGDRYQTLKGVTGSSKTYTMAKIIETVQRPTLVLSH
ncbi:MAG: excinuclease ABC subunit B, partial [Sphaerochaeta sp.]|nr:excinuclease ABC subunit B [Sphaerochaeta sp.]